MTGLTATDEGPLPAATVAVTVCAEAPLAAKSTDSMPYPIRRARLRRMEFRWSAPRNARYFVSRALLVRIIKFSPIKPLKPPTSPLVSLFSACCFESHNRHTSAARTGAGRWLLHALVDLALLRMAEFVQIKIWSVRPREQISRCLIFIN